MGPTVHYAKKPMKKEDLAKRRGFRSIATFDTWRERPAEYGKGPVTVDPKQQRRRK